MSPLVPCRPLGMNLCVRGDDARCFELSDLLVGIVEQAAQDALRMLAQQRAWGGHVAWRF